MEFNFRKVYNIATYGVEIGCSKIIYVLRVRLFSYCALKFQSTLTNIKYVNNAFNCFKK